MNTIHHLFNQVKTIVKVYEKHTELTGENFNIFRIMNMERDEVNTHSAIIAELLNPKGSHGLGCKPLELFIKNTISEDSNFSFDCGSAYCHKELYIGKINDDKTEGGRVDIIVKDRNNEFIVIENKIDALEQENQLSRYKTKYPKSNLFFLTPNGDESKSKDAPEYHVISYKEHILKWVEACTKEAFGMPMVREILNHYAILIRKLTDQSTNKEMEEEMQKLIKENYQESLEIYRNFETSKQAIINDFFDELLEKCKNKDTLKGWNLTIDKGGIFETKRFKTLLISDKNAKFFFYLRYRFINDEIFMGIVCANELHKPQELLDACGERNMKAGQRSVVYENMKNLNTQNLIIDYLNKDSENLFNNIIEIIETYLVQNKELYKNLNKFISSLDN